MGGHLSLRARLVGLVLAGATACAAPPAPPPQAAAPPPPQPHVVDAFEAAQLALVRANPPGVALEVTMEGRRARYKLGEPVKIALAFSSSIPEHTRVSVHEYDRSGRVASEQFVVDPSDDVANPLVDYFRGATGGMGGFSKPPPWLGREPTVVRATLNEWVRFDKPGRRRFYVTSTRTNPPSTSNLLDIEIVDDTAWSDLELQRLEAGLAKGGAEADAARVGLRYLGTGGAARVLVDQLCAPGEGHDLTVQFGIFGSPRRAAVLAALRDGLTRPTCPVGPSYLWTLTRLEIVEAGGAKPSFVLASGRATRKILKTLVPGLAAKVPAARAVSVHAALRAMEDMRPREDGDDALGEGLRKEFAAIMSLLPPESLQQILADDWILVRSSSPELVALLEMLVLEGRPRGGELRSLSDVALERLVELAPASARKLILAELTRPGGARVSFSSRTLGALPDRELPALDGALLAGMQSELHDGATLELRAELTARYASGAIVKDVWAAYRASSYFRTSLLTYLVRHDRAAAAAEIKKLGTLDAVDRLAPHGWNAALEELALGQLGTRNGRHAAQLLAKWAGPSAEAPMMRALASPALRGGDPDVFAEAVRAFATARAWATPPPKLRALAALCPTDACRREVESLARHWKGNREADLALWTPHGKPAGWLAQYDIDSLDGLLAKLRQLPRGTLLRVSTDVNEAPTAEVQAAVNRVAKERGIVIAR